MAERVPMGKIAGVYGVRGWVHVLSGAEPPESLLGYRSWILVHEGLEQEYQVATGRRHGKGLVARLEGVTEREFAERLIGSEIQVDRASMPMLGEDDYYWCDLIGLAVETTGGQNLGRIRAILETGANDVLIVDGERERMIPFIRDQVIRKVDLKARRMVVDWHPED